MIQLNIELDDLLKEINHLEPKLTPKQISFIKDLCDGKIVATHRGFGRSTVVRLMTAAIYKLFEETDYTKRPDVKYSYEDSDLLNPEMVDEKIRPYVNEEWFEKEFRCNYHIINDNLNINENDVGELFAQGAT